jgi:hypothetical protein
MKRTWSPEKVIGFYLLLFLSLAICATVAVLNGFGVLMNENQVLYLFSTSAQVIAAIYGLTLTGFIFFRNELNREESEDDTLVDAVENLKARYFVLLVFITILVTATLILANIALSYESSGEGFLKTLIINSGQAAFLTSLFAVAYFIFDVISPKRIERASQTLQSKFDPTLAEQTTGSFEEFLRNYNELEMLLADVGKAYEDSFSSSNTQRYPRRVSNSRLAVILYRNKRIDEKLYNGLRDLITLRNAIIHGPNPAVSQEMVNVSADILAKLRLAVTVDNTNGS